MLTGRVLSRHFPEVGFNTNENHIHTNAIARSSSLLDMLPAQGSYLKDEHVFTCGEQERVPVENSLVPLTAEYSRFSRLHRKVGNSIRPIQYRKRSVSRTLLRRNLDCAYIAEANGKRVYLLDQEKNDTNSLQAESGRSRAKVKKCQLTTPSTRHQYYPTGIPDTKVRGELHLWRIWFFPPLSLRFGSDYRTPHTALLLAWLIFKAPRASGSVKIVQLRENAICKI